MPVAVSGPAVDGALAAKRDRLERILGGLGRTLIAYSGGVDSALLLAEAHRVLGGRAQGVIADSASLPRAELDAALALADGRGIPVRVIETREMDRSEYRANGPDRCYHCKAELFDRLAEIAAREGWDTLAYGAVTDDLGESRPGMKAAAGRHVRAPLVEAEMGKLDVRVLARAVGLPVWEKPQSACLASRIPHGTPVTPENLAQVEAGEARLRAALGLRVLRVRYEGRRARLEVPPAEIGRLSVEPTMGHIRRILNELGFDQVALDPRGYRRPDPMPMPHSEEVGDARSG
jgi:uncharacterized protein